MSSDPREGGLPRSACPICGHPIDSATEVGNSDEPVAPRDRDLCLCIDCGAMLIYANAKENIMVEARPADLAGLDADLLVQLVRGQKLIRKRGRIIPI